MAYEKLLPVDKDKTLKLSHFPTRFHAAVFRLWETVPMEQIAKGLGIELKWIKQAAEDMGLPAQKNMMVWKDRGYITTIRNCWHILPYEQLLGVLDWTEDQLDKILREEDFLFVKMGYFKPHCEPVKVEPLNQKQQEQLSQIKRVMQTECCDLFDGKRPFHFFDETPETFAVKSEAANSDNIIMIFSYQGLITTTLDHDIEISCPETLLKKYRENGINAIWVFTILYQVVPFPFDETYSKGWELRQQRLRELIALAAKYDIKVFLYLNEPRCMPLSFFQDHPELQGRTYHDTRLAALCTGNASVLQYLRDGIRFLCDSVPGLGGFFLINQSENLTHCKSRTGGEECIRCRDVSHPKLIAEVINAIYEGATAADPKLQVIAWTWAWDNMTPEECLECIDMLPEEVILLSNSEAKKETNIAGIKGNIRDYSMSIPGPGDWSKKLWNHAKERGMEIGAKVQLNVTWECSTVPFLPVFDLIREHMTNLKRVGVKHLMMSWTLGGYPSINLKVASACLKNASESEYDKLLMEEYGNDWQRVKKAVSIFSEAFREFPFYIGCLYHGPQNPGPSNLLYKEPTGFTSTMTCFCYDDLELWRGIYPEEIFCEQFRKLSMRWKEGLAEIESMDDCELKQAAWAGYLLFYSSYLQTEYIMKRDRNDTTGIKEILEKERENALMMYQLMIKNSAIGYEAANHYFFNRGMLAEKIICCDHLLDDWK